MSTVVVMALLVKATNVVFALVDVNARALLARLVIVANIALTLKPTQCIDTRTMSAVNTVFALVLVNTNAADTVITGLTLAAVASLIVQANSVRSAQVGLVTLINVHANSFGFVHKEPFVTLAIVGTWLVNAFTLAQIASVSIGNTLVNILALAASILLITRKAAARKATKGICTLGVSAIVRAVIALVNVFFACVTIETGFAVAGSLVPLLEAHFGTLSAALVDVATSSQPVPLGLDFGLVAVHHFGQLFQTAHLLVALSCEIVVTRLLEESAVLSADSEELDLRTSVIDYLVGEHVLPEH